MDGQFRQLASQSMGDENASQDTGAHTSHQESLGEAPRIMTDSELLISLHQKVDRNHD